MFRLIEPSSGQIQNIALVHSVSAYYGIPYCLQNYIDVKDWPIYLKKKKKIPVFKIYIKAYQ
jgi:hypothetical protein